MFDGAAKKLRSVFLVGFLLTMAMALTSYVDSSFVGTYVKVTRIGLLFSLSSLVAIIFLTRLPKIVSRLGVPATFHLISMLYLLAVLGMLYLGNPISFQILFVIYLASGVAAYFCLDIMIEHFSKERLTGGIRGFYLAIYNLAYLLGPLLAGIILKESPYEILYLLSGVFVIVMTLIFVRDLETVAYSKPVNIGKSLWRNFLKLSKNRHLFAAYSVSVSLAFFFSWMAIYVPIYLNQFVGFGWDQIGAIFAIMHIPYVTLEIPLGRLADRYNHEPKMMATGLFIIGVATMALSTFGEATFWVWALGLTATRIGASFVQVATESYFFRQVTEADESMIAVFRNTGPIAYILGPLLATAALALVSYNHLFIVLGLIMIAVIPLTSRLRNGKKHERLANTYK